VAEYLCLRVWPDYTSSGIWELDEPGAFYLGRCVHPSLPQDLAARFAAWMADFDSTSPFHDDEPPNGWDAFMVEMIGLAVALKAHLGPDVHVEYQMWGRFFTVGEAPH
jgi:hypothetical protein